MSQPTFLYIEDHAASREMMRILLQQLLGYQQLVMFENTVDVPGQLAQSRQHSFDVVFLDLNLYPIDGRTICRLLRGHPATQNAHIVGLTATISGKQQEQMRHQGFNGVLGKPVSHRTFPYQLERILQGEEVWEYE